MKAVVMKLSKHYGNNIAGEIASFAEPVAAHIEKLEGGTRLAVIDLAQGEKYDIASGKAIKAK